MAESKSLLELAARVAELEARNAELEARNADLQAFSAVAAHELLEPLIVIEARAMLAAEEPSPAADLDAIRAVAARARRLVEQLLHESRPDRPPVPREPVDLQQVVEAAFADLPPSEFPVALAADGLPTVPGDPILLSSVFANLLSNAVRYGPREPTTVRVTAELTGDDAVIAIRSAGKPLASAEVDALFEPFRGGEHPRGRGWGLGLTLCRRVIERHGGRIELVPLEDGNAVVVTLPRS